MPTAGYFTGYATPFGTAYFPGLGASSPPVLDGSAAGYFTAYATPVATPYFPGSTPVAPLPPAPAPAPPATIRDWDVLEDIARRLRATGAFDGVFFSDLPELRGRGADLRSIAVVSPDGGSEGDGWDDPAEDQWVRTADWTLSVTARDDDPRRRDRRAERLVNVAMAALDYRCLAEITLPEWTKIASYRYLPAAPPSRTVRASGSFAYLVDGPAGHATNP